MGAVEVMSIQVLFVCMGNICRSPTAEGVFALLVQKHGLAHQILIDSAGTHAYHVGAAPDRRSQEAAQRRGIDISHLKGRQVSVDDFTQFDYILAMDHENYANLMAICPPSNRKRLRLFLSFATDVKLEEVPDPYYGGETGFERVLDLIENAAQGLLKHITQQHRFGAAG